MRVSARRKLSRGELISMDSSAEADGHAACRIAVILADADDSLV